MHAMRKRTALVIVAHARNVLRMVLAGFGLTTTSRAKGALNL